MANKDRASISSSATALAQSVPSDVVARLRHQAQMTYVWTQIPHNEEYTAAVLSNGAVIYTMVSDRGGKFGLPLGVVLLIHTHPCDSLSVPSDADKATAKKIAAPNCVVTAREVWCAMPNGKVVPGELSSARPSRVAEHAATRPMLISPAVMPSS